MKPYERRKPRVDQPIILPETRPIDPVEPENTIPAETENPINDQRENPVEALPENPQNENNGVNYVHEEINGRARNATPNTVGTPASNDISETEHSRSYCDPRGFQCSKCSIQ